MKKAFFTRTLIPVLGLAGILYGAYFVIVHSRPDMTPNVQANLPPTSPYADTISGSGLIEANSRNVDIGSHLSGVATEVLVTEGQLVSKGAPLFSLDDRTAKASFMERQGDVAAAAAQLEEAKALLEDSKDQLSRAEQLKPGVSITVDKLERARYAVRTAEARVGVAKSNWEAAKSRQSSAKVTMDKLTVKAPIAGRILKVNIRPGEYVQAGPEAKPPVVMGNDRPLYVRVSVDENDLWRLKEGSKAEGALRSNRGIHFPMSFVRVEPFVVPKVSLTGSTSERVDTRVLEVLYKIDDTEAPLFIGQQVDVFIQAAKKE